MNLTTGTTSDSSAGRSAAVVDQVRRIVEPKLRTAVSSLPTPLNRMADYHFGWSDDTGGPGSGGGAGKLVRPALTVCSCTACGGEPSSAASAAAAVELIHNFTLIHDDVMDCDATRRNRPTVWAVWGVSDAILLGDGLHALAAQVLAAQLPLAVAGSALRRLESTVIELCRAQHEDCRTAPEPVPTIEYCEGIARGKTAALMGCACALGALCAGADEDTVAMMDRFGRELGVAFQIVDDLIGIWGDPTVTGKPADDLVRQRYTLPVVAAMQSGTDAAAELKKLYARTGPLSVREAALAAELVEAAGGRQWAQNEVDRLVNDAFHCLPACCVSAELDAMSKLMTHRKN
ncbi:polyprenyl synthetase family protein [Nocardia brasiliensis]|uniref:polyprenyl synthetase family protein n=1 Tax=Nocardia brasiliensis TaxID=37326 RepID=UPI0018960AFD|nr:polyprenyl synthetase family protein [Nocardia brasiliensis]MBF6125616.1 polyprenyl synthetase family protein [Nocardia brasiliensis]